MSEEQTTLAVQRYLNALSGDDPAEPIVRALLDRSVHRLQVLCANLLYRGYPRLMQPPMNLRPDELLGAVVERLLKALRPDYTGSSDLDSYGQWNEVPDYGWCWTPEVDAGWVPYSAGSWGYEPYWGWTWISAEPWGWAPYHYGRWFMYGGAWRWWPARGFYGGGARWAPAYVSFFGFGGRGMGVGFGFGFGSIGWLALGPRDVFHPWYGAGHGFAAMGFNDIHGAGNIRAGGPRFGSNLETMGTDAHVRSALRSVSSQEFSSGRMGHSMPVSENMLHSASMIRGSLPVGHTQASMGRPASNFSGNRSMTASGEHFFSRSGSESMGRVGGSTEAYGARTNSMATGRTEAGSARTPSYNWQRYATPGRSPASGNNSSAYQGRTAGNSWQRYASPNPYSGGRQSYYGQQGSSRGWNGAAPRSGGSYYGGGSRPPLNLNRPIMSPRSNSGSSSGNGRTQSAPRNSGGGHSYSAPRGGGGGGGGGHSGGGGGHGGRR